jgi:hypothetical protein
MATKLERLVKDMILICREANRRLDALDFKSKKTGGGHDG